MKEFNQKLNLYLNLNQTFPIMNRATTKQRSFKPEDIVRFSDNHGFIAPEKKTNLSTAIVRPQLSIINGHSAGSKRSFAKLASQINKPLLLTVTSSKKTVMF